LDIGDQSREAERLSKRGEEVKLKNSTSPNLQYLGLALFLSCGLSGAIMVSQDKPPQIGDGRAPTRQPELVELASLDPTLRLDIRYATANNLVGRPVYDEARAFLQRPAAEALLRAHQSLKQHGYGLLIFDGYRPWSVTKIFWDVTPPEKRQFVADPAKGSKHNHGCAVDLSLYDLKTGKEVTMPGVYDEMSERSYPTYHGGTIEQRTARDLLRKMMEKEGFTVYPFEWWHFDYKDWEKYPILDTPFSQIGTVHQR
jgi:D-alanyl-D-alanine dipeptidase